MITAILTIAKNTFRESMRSKILYSLFFFAIALILLSLFFGSVTIGDRSKVVTSFGLFAVSLFSVAYAVIAGTTLLQKELAKKTIYNILAKPVERWQFLVGKYLGMLATATLMVVLMGLGLGLFLWLLENQLNSALLFAYYSMALQLLIVCAFAIYFSAIVVTPLLSGAFTFGLFLAGRSSNYILSLVNSPDVSPTLKPLLQGVYYLIPHLDWIDVSDEAIYYLSLPEGFLFYATTYCLGYAAVVLLLAALIFRLREFN